MISDYEMQNLVQVIKSHVESTVLLTNNNVIQLSIQNLTQNQKDQLSQAYFEGTLMNLRLGRTIIDEKIIKFLEESDVIKKHLESECKEILNDKMYNILRDISTDYKYQELFNILKSEVGLIIKKSVKDIMHGENKSIINNALKVVTLAFAEVSFKEHATSLFNKAQKLINEEIVKDIIE